MRANNDNFFAKRTPGKLSLSRYYMSRLSARSGLAACIYPCCYIPAFLPAVALAFAILGTISAQIYRSEIYAGRDTKDISRRICSRGTLVGEFLPEK